MPNITYFTDHSSALENIKGVEQNVTNTIDFSLAPVTASDTVNLLNIPAGAIVKSIDMIMITAATATCTMNVGDGTTADLFDAAVDLEGVAGTHTGTSGTESTLRATNGKYYAAAGFVVGTMAHTNAQAKFAITAHCILLNVAHA
jgi:hypothetical protein